MNADQDFRTNTLGVENVSELVGAAVELVIGQLLSWVRDCDRIRCLCHLSFKLLMKALAGLRSLGLLPRHQQLMPFC